MNINELINTIESLEALKRNGYKYIYLDKHNNIFAQPKTGKKIQVYFDLSNIYESDQRENIDTLILKAKDVLRDIDVIKNENVVFEKKRTTIRFEEDLLKKLKLYAIANNTSCTKVVNKACRIFLEKGI